MDEINKMRSGEEYDFSTPVMAESFGQARVLCQKLNSCIVGSEEYRKVIEQLVPSIPKSSTICPPFHCDHGHGIIIGEETFINYNCTILDSAYVRIGDHVKIGPNCQIYTPQHPIHYLARRQPHEQARPVTIGDDTWICGGVIVCPGVTIGKRCIIAAGSVVVSDIPDDSLAAGQPAVVKKQLDSDAKA